jgi:hypothetical protein
MDHDRVSGGNESVPSSGVVVEDRLVWEQVVNGPDDA